MSEKNTRLATSNDNTQQTIARTTNEKPQRSISPLSPCFPDSWQKNPDWLTVTPEGTKSAWQRRLSWRGSDVALATFLEFLEHNGRDTALDADEWHKELNRLLVHRTCRHLLFLLIYSHLHDEDFLKDLRLESDTEALFIQWKKHWENDKELTGNVQRICSDEHVREKSGFRGIPLCEAMTYPTFGTICSEQKGGKNDGQ